MANLQADLKLLDPSSNSWVQVDTGGVELLLLNILLELRVHSAFMQVMNSELITDDLSQMRLDACSDPSSLTSFTPTVSS